MATSVDIVSALGHGLVASQVGPSAGYDAIDDRRFWSVGLNEGVISPGTFAVTQRAAGPNLSVDVAASTGNGALVQGDSVTGQGLYFVASHTAVINLDVAAANATNPRNDLVVLEVKDDQHDVDGLNVARVRIISGTPTAGALRTDGYGVNGTPALPSSCLALAVANVPALDTTIADAQINDRRTYVWPGAIVGEIRSYAGVTAPTGWKLCDGSAIARVQYASLFAVLSTTYGVGDGTVTFNIPDLRGRVPVGVDGAAARLSANDALGQSAGTQTHTLTTGEMPAHTHPPEPPAVAFQTFESVSGGALGTTAGTSQRQNLTATGSTGGGGAHNNMQPYQIVNWIIFTGHST